MMIYLQSMEHLVEALRQAGFERRVFGPEHLRSLEREMGAYVMLLQLSPSIQISTAKTGTFVLNPGFYTYCGSAKGPGGLQARIKRHFSQEKKLHWHIDHLTVKAADMAAMAFPHATECDLVSALTNSGLFAAPVSGFGSSDCTNCSSHLLMLK